MSAKVVVAFEAEPESRDVIRSGLPQAIEIVYLADLTGPDRLQAFEEADVVLFFLLSKETIAEEKKLLAQVSLLQSIPAGVDMLPMAELPQGPTICANVGAWAGPLAEWVIGIMIALDREFMAFRDELGAGTYDRRWTGWLRGRTFGVVGFGGIGQASARLAKMLGMKIMAINTSGRTDQEVDFIGSMSDMDQVLTQSDVVLLSTPLNNITRSMISTAQMATMKDDAILINVGRGAVIDEDALYEHLKTHPDFKFGSDVWWREGDDYSLKHPIFDFPNVLGTPHNADHVADIQAEALALAVENINDHLNGKPLRGVVNRADYE